MKLFLLGFVLSLLWIGPHPEGFAETLEDKLDRDGAVAKARATANTQKYPSGFLPHVQAEWARQDRVRREQDARELHILEMKHYAENLDRRVNWRYDPPAPPRSLTDFSGPVPDRATRFDLDYAFEIERLADRAPCRAAAITSKVLVTARHCTTGQPGGVRVVGSQSKSNQVLSGAGDLDLALVIFDAPTFDKIAPIQDATFPEGHDGYEVARTRELEGDSGTPLFSSKGGLMGVLKGCDENRKYCVYTSLSGQRGRALLKNLPAGELGGVKYVTP